MKAFIALLILVTAMLVVMPPGQAEAKNVDHEISFVADVGQIAPAAFQQEIGGVVLSYDVEQLYYQTGSPIKLEDRLYCIQSAKEFKLQPVENYLIKLKFDPLLTLSSADRIQRNKEAAYGIKKIRNDTQKEV